MSKNSNKFVVILLFVCIVQLGGIVYPNVNNTMYQIKKKFLTLKSNHTAVDILKFLIEQYELYPSAHFVQEYVTECNQILQAIDDEQVDYRYQEIALLFFKEMCRFNIVALQCKYARVIFAIQKAIVYWSYQYEHPWVYMLHKSPLKWFYKESVTDEIHEHLTILENALKDYTIKLGRLINHGALVLNSNIAFSFEHISKIAQEVSYLYTVSKRENSTYTKKKLSCVKALSIFASAQNDVVFNLLEPVKKHMIPNHVERYWGRYVVGISLVYVLYMQKSNANSWLNNVIKEHHLIQYEQNFIKSFKRNFILPFKQLGNVLFGIPLDIAGDYPERFEPLVQAYNDGVNHVFALADRRYDKLPDNFDLKLSLPYQLQLPDKDLKGYQLIWKLLMSKNSDFILNRAEVAVPNVDWTEEQKEIFFQTNQLAGYALYQFLSAKSVMLLTFLNMSHEIDLILKMIAIMPAIGLVYGSYKGVKRVYKFACHANYEPLHSILVDMQACILEAGNAQNIMDEDKSSYISGKLFVLKYSAKKSARVVFSKDAYKAFLKDLNKIQIVPGDINNGSQTIELMIKKYNINSFVC